MNRVVLPSKRLGETVVVPPGGIDFTSQLQPSETISSATITASVYSGTDPNPGAIVSGAASVSGTVVSQKITGGVLGVIYELLFVLLTSAGQTIEVAGYLAITQDLP